MKKWVTTYLLSVGFILLSLSGIANHTISKTAVKENITSFSKTAKSFYFKINGDQAGNNLPEEICSSIYNIHHAGCSQTIPFLPEEYTPLISFTRTANTVAVSSASILNGYLLHLFPSHYFW